MIALDDANPGFLLGMLGAEPDELAHLVPQKCPLQSVETPDCVSHLGCLETAMSTLSLRVLS